jgi:hypothetical protein
MSAQQLAEEIEASISSAIGAFSSDIETFQGILDGKLLSVLKNLELDSDGYIKQSAVNRRILYDAENLIYDLLPGSNYTAIVSQALTVIPAIDSLNSDYFTAISDSFNSNRTFFSSLQKQTISSIENNLLQDGLTASIKDPLVSILNQNVNSGGQFPGFLQQVRDYIKGTDEVEGRLLSYSRTYLSDALFDYHRSFQQAVVNDLKLTWYSYSGGVMDKTRPFCEERVGNFYHQKEIESWANTDWQGKRPGTTSSSIFIYCGGYNCRHSLIPVSETLVPKIDLDRMKKP